MSERPRSDVVTIVAVAVAAYALDDLVHEVLGHGTAALLVPGVQVLSLSTVALQTTGNSRIVAAAGSIANVLVGVAMLALLRRRARMSATTYFLWLFGSVNLLNGAGYPLFSAVLAFGDWNVVVHDLEPALLWRTGEAILGGVAYGGAVLASAGALARAVAGGAIDRAEVARIVFVAYVAGGLLLLGAAVFNPIDPGLILLSGLSSGFAAMAGLTLVPSMVERRTSGWTTAGGVIGRSPAWIVAGLAIGAFFIAIVAPGIRFQN